MVEPQKALCVREAGVGASTPQKAVAGGLGGTPSDPNIGDPEVEKVDHHLLRDQGVAGSNPVSPTQNAAILDGKPAGRGLRRFTPGDSSAVVLPRRPVV